jgi:hypothetical protein
MKNSEIHNGLEKKEIRDFLGIQLLRLYEEEVMNKKPTFPYNRNAVDPFEWSIKDTEAQIETLKKSLDVLKGKQAIVKLIAMNGWNEYDISDIIERDMPYSLKMNFIGTEKEHSELQKILRDDNR